MIDSANILACLIIVAASIGAISYAMVAFRTMCRRSGAHDRGAVHSVVMIAFAVATVVFGHYKTQAEKGSSGVEGLVIFYHPDPDVIYLYDRGSYVYSNRVDIMMRIKYLPDDAHIQIWTTPLSVTNWVCYGDITAAEWNNYYVPDPGIWTRSIEYENASSNRWCIFTPYIRPTQVLTNGLLHVLGVLPEADAETVVGVPLHTSVDIDGEKIDLGTKQTTKTMEANDE